MNTIRKAIKDCSRNWRALAVPAAMIMAVTAPATAAQAASQQDWRVTGTVVFDMMDYETFGANERCRHNVPISNKGRVGGPSVNYWYFGKCGGEIRTEIHYRLTRGSAGTVTVDNISIPFFEGATANTTDRDGWATIRPFIIWPGQSITKQVRVQNDAEDQPDDRTIVTFTLRNW
ncbi:hypothetical protein [Nonomuraea jiangxiensis]|uniref:Uncharacterized protein n=1 Tax=Nonomuraea jiangxiensis TaxID=633440 RepID=A0A1G9TLE2_9ACTN|nr:hypothetical protein [Nonomuraea jiangxiensis]SDM48470.1 hypothetical protein SAMN05421869_14525 [Nonomuraea jiangxiensis]